MNTEPAINTEDLSFGYSSGWSLQGITLSVQPGEILGVIGPNGAGKSTLLRLLATLLLPKDGRLTILGVDARKARRQVQPRISFVPQSGSLDPGLTVRENLLFAGLLQGLSWRAARRRGGELAEIFGIGGFRDAKAGQLSGGQYRRAVLARAFVGRAELLLLDEPTAGIDPAARQSFYVFLRELVRTGRLAIVFTSHDLQEVGILADQVVALRDGRVECFRPAPSVRASAGTRMLQVTFVAPVDEPAEVISLPEVGELRRVDERSFRIQLLGVHSLNRLLRALARHGQLKSVESGSAVQEEETWGELTATGGPS